MVIDLHKHKIDGNTKSDQRKTIQRMINYKNNLILKK